MAFHLCRHLMLPGNTACFIIIKFWSIQRNEYIYKQSVYLILSFFFPIAFLSYTVANFLYI